MADKTQRSFEKEYLEKRCETLGQFLDCICESETLRSSIHVLSFLKCTDEDQWNKIKEELEKNQKKTSGLRDNFSKKLFEGKNGLRVEDFENLHGDIQCRITGSLKDYSNELDELIKVSEPLYQKYCSRLTKVDRPDEAADSGVWSRRNNDQQDSRQCNRFVQHAQEVQ